ncbi:uncharacterized protein LOC109608276 [Aethina tumida]|uniref:uncharacterized protein LOC109608276 n=1 Tax=Aethina tumida TaxID=116153 RepID=UPI00096B2FED|nr:uncharacterized protein LOC109608276 [Aethina tumida]XP_049817670.1 uncharacterized protein LOC109608276 [Aethina tumida]
MACLLTRSILLFATLFVDISIFDVGALKDMHIRVPEAVRVGDSVTLACDYDLESVALYTIKWYRFEEEFYRYVPKESPPSKVFAMPHITVDVSKSNSREVTLTGVERETSGEYKCEVSADAPLFHTDIRSANLLVASIPDEGPVLRTEVQKVAPGAEIRANCTTAGSYPSMNVTWFINDKEISPKYKYDVQNSIIRYDALPGLETVRSSISIREAPDLFKGGKMRLKCTTTMYSLYAASKEAEIQEDAPRLALIMEPTAHTNQVSSSVSKNVKFTPLISSIFYVYLYTWVRRLVCN